jgi:Ubiquinol-cytochrome C reductase, UQCRX/QCR9 like
VRVHTLTMASFMYRQLFRHNAVFWSSILAGAFITELVIDAGVDKAWNAMNRKVSAYCCHFSVFFVRPFRRNSGKTLKSNILNTS